MLRSLCEFFSVICSTKDTSSLVTYGYFFLFFSFAFSSLMLQVSLNNGTTFVSSNVNITTKNCTQPVKPTEGKEMEEEKEPTKVDYVVVFT